ncbi:MAG: hypothetical protein F6J93_03235 [Oscillatoria sp. SIO1A7]|nr:hypothetical protein [Oscillatoria sp. SIO1A7]
MLPIATITHNSSRYFSNTALGYLPKASQIQIRLLRDRAFLSCGKRIRPAEAGRFFDTPQADPAIFTAFCKPIAPDDSIVGCYCSTLVISDEIAIQ